MKTQTKTKQLACMPRANTLMRKNRKCQNKKEQVDDVYRNLPRKDPLNVLSKESNVFLVQALELHRSVICCRGFLQRCESVLRRRSNRWELCSGGHRRDCHGFRQHMMVVVADSKDVHGRLGKRQRGALGHGCIAHETVLVPRGREGIGLALHDCWQTACCWNGIGDSRELGLC